MRSIYIIGDGCAGLSSQQGGRSARPSAYIGNSRRSAPVAGAHMGILASSRLDVSLAHKAWVNWRIVTEETSAELAL